MKTNSIESEQGVLGAILQNESNLFDAINELKVSDFSQGVSQAVFSAITELHSARMGVDMFTVQDKFKDVETRSYIGELIKQPGVSRNLKTYIQRIKETSLTRKLLMASSEIYQLAENEQPTVAVEKAQSILSSLVNDSDTSGPKHIKDVMPRLYASLEDRDANKGKIMGLATGFDELDKRFNGIKSTDLMIIAARPSMGKTSFALNIVENAIYRLKKSALVFSMEMSDEQLVEKHISSLGHIPLKTIKDGSIATSEKFGTFGHVVEKLMGSELFIDDTPGLTISQLRSRAHKVSRQCGGLSCIMVDYIGLMSSSNPNQMREQVISEISRGLKALAKELHCPVIALSQLNRGVEQRPDKRPLMSDLRESGAIEQDADIITFLYRDEYYNDNTPFKGVAEVITRKFRMGEVGTDALGFDGAHSKFTNLDYRPDLTRQPENKNKSRGMNF